jgi:hypothetical protein
MMAQNIKYQALLWHSSMPKDIFGMKERKIQKWKKCYGTNRGHFHSQNCNFPEESFILISFRYSVG